MSAKKLKSDHDILTRLDERVDTILQRLDEFSNFCKQANNQLDIHSVNIKELQTNVKFLDNGLNKHQIKHQATMTTRLSATIAIAAVVSAIIGVVSKLGG